MHVFFYEAFEEEEKALKHHLMPHITAGFTWETLQEAGYSEPPAPIISLRTQSILPLSWAPKVSGILARSTGCDHLQIYMRDCDEPVSCGYLPLYCNRSVAEQAILLMMSLMRKLPQQVRSFPAFHRDGLTGHEIEKKNLLIVGVGSIGYEAVRMGRGLGMKGLGVDLVKRYDDVSYVSIDEGLALADVILCAMTHTPRNRDYFNYRLLKKARPGSTTGGNP